MSHVKRKRPSGGSGATTADTGSSKKPRRSTRGTPSSSPTPTRKTTSKAGSNKKTATSRAPVSSHEDFQPLHWEHDITASRLHSSNLPNHPHWEHDRSPTGSRLHSVDPPRRSHSKPHAATSPPVLHTQSHQSPTSNTHHWEHDSYSVRLHSTDDIVTPERAVARVSTKKASSSASAVASIKKNSIRTPSRTQSAMKRNAGRIADAQSPPAFSNHETNDQDDAYDGIDSTDVVTEVTQSQSHTIQTEDLDSRWGEWEKLFSETSDRICLTVIIILCVCLIVFLILLLQHPKIKLFTLLLPSFSSMGTSIGVGMGVPPSTLVVSDIHVQVYHQRMQTYMNQVRSNRMDRDSDAEGYPSPDPGSRCDGYLNDVLSLLHSYNTSAPVDMEEEDGLEERIVRRWGDGSAASIVAVHMDACYEFETTAHCGALFAQLSEREYTDEKMLNDDLWHIYHEHRLVLYGLSSFCNLSTPTGAANSKDALARMKMSMEHKDRESDVLEILQSIEKSAHLANQEKSDQSESSSLLSG